MNNKVNWPETNLGTRGESAAMETAAAIGCKWAYQEI